MFKPLLQNLTLACSLSLPAFAPAAAFAQMSVGDGSGARVQVGPGGVTVEDGSGDTVSNGPGGSTVAGGGSGCPGGRRQISGSGKSVTLAGPCSLVEVSGSRNTVRVRLAPGARVTISGSDNKVRWTAADPAGAPPSFEVNGTRNGYDPTR